MGSGFCDMGIAVLHALRSESRISSHMLGEVCIVSCVLLTLICEINFFHLTFRAIKVSFKRFNELQQETCTEPLRHHYVHIIYSTVLAS